MLEYRLEPAKVTDRVAVTHLTHTCDKCGAVSEGKHELNPRSLGAIGNMDTVRRREASFVGRELERDHLKVCTA